MSVVCVTGGSGYIGSWLVKKLLDRGCVVHATLRSIADEEKTALLRALPGAAERLRVRLPRRHAHVARHDASSTKYKDVTEATLDAMRIILGQCERSGTVRRVIHTASATAASPLKEDGTGFGDAMDESCWTPPNLSFQFSNAYLEAYVASKTLAEKELLRYNDEGQARGASLEVVSLVCPVVGGDTIQASLCSSVPVILSPLTGSEPHHNSLLFVQALLGSVPLAHVEDVCSAHAFCMDQPSMAGRFICASGCPTMRDIVDHFAAKHPDLEIRLKEVAGEGVRRVPVDTSKLVDMWFRYKFGVEETLDGSVECAKRFGDL